MAFVSIAGMMFCLAMAITGWMSWKDTKDWRFLAGSGFYGIAALALTCWLF